MHGITGLCLSAFIVCTYSAPVSQVDSAEGTLIQNNFLFMDMLELQSALILSELNGTTRSITAFLTSTKDRIASKIQGVSGSKAALDACVKTWTDGLRIQVNKMKAQLTSHDRIILSRFGEEFFNMLRKNKGADSNANLDLSLNYTAVYQVHEAENFRSNLLQSPSFWENLLRYFREAYVCLGTLMLKYEPIDYTSNTPPELSVAPEEVIDISITSSGALNY